MRTICWILAFIPQAVVCPSFAQVQTQVFVSAQSITIRDLNTASVYPSTINVSSLPGIVTKASITLSNLAHTWPDDVDILLVGPTGAKVKVMSDAGGGAGVTNVTLTLDSTAAQSLPDGGTLAAGTFRPADFDGGNVDTFPSPAPLGPYETNLNAFVGTSPNGTWRLFVVDDAEEDTGLIKNGWRLTLTTSNQLALPNIIGHPTNFLAHECGNAQFSVVASGGSPLVFQWRLNGVDLPGATTSVLALNGVRFWQAGPYSVMVSNLAGAVISSNASLEVLTTGQGSDTLSEATPICPESLGWFSTSGTISSTDPFSPVGVPAVWWSVRPDFNQRLFMDTSGSGANTAISIYRGNAADGLFHFASGNNRLFGAVGDDSTFLEVTLFAGQEYQIAVLSENGSSGSYQLRLENAFPAYGSFFVTGVPPGGVMTNSDDLTISISAGGLIQFANLRLRDNGRLIYQRDVQEVNGAFHEFQWNDPPAGIHSLTLEVVSEGETNYAGPFDFLVVGRELGFDRWDDLPPQTTNTGTVVTGTLVVRNQLPTPTSPLRIRCIKAATTHGRGFTPIAPGPEELVAAFGQISPTGGSLPAGNVWVLPITRQMGLVCPFYEGGFEPTGTQFHIYALLEELQGGQWIVVDRIKLTSSEPNPLSPPNEGQIGQDGAYNTTLQNYVVAPLLLEGPASIFANSATSLVARVRLSNNTTNTVTPTWSVNPPFSISATGTLTAPPLAASSNAVVTARYTRSIQTLNATKTIAVLKPSEPEVLQFLSPRITAGRFRATIKGAPNTTYQVLAGTNVNSLLPFQSVVTDAAGEVLLDVPATNSAHRQFFKAQRTQP